MIPPEAVKVTALVPSEMLLNTMNKLLEFQEFPVKWKMARVFLMQKNGKTP